MTDAQEEHPWGFEREPDIVSRFRIDGLKEDIQQVKVETREAVSAAMLGLKAAMSTLRDPSRGPDPDAAEDDDIRRLASIIERLAQRPPDNGYREAPKDSSIKGIIVGCTVAVIGSAVGLSYQFAAMRAEFTEWKQATEYRLQQLERRP